MSQNNTKTYIFAGPIKGLLFLFLDSFLAFFLLFFKCWIVAFQARGCCRYPMGRKVREKRCCHLFIYLSSLLFQPIWLSTSFTVIFVTGWHFSGISLPQKYLFYYQRLYHLSIRCFSVLLTMIARSNKYKACLKTEKAQLNPELIAASEACKNCTFSDKTKRR